jgi:WD40 repeat protein
LKVWNLQTGQVEGTLTGHEDWVRAVAVTPDGQRAISGAADGTLKVWNLPTGQEVVSITLDGSLWCVAVVPGGGRPSGAVTLVAGDRAGNVYCLGYAEPGNSDK